MTSEGIKFIFGDKDISEEDLKDPDTLKFLCEKFAYPKQKGKDGKNKDLKCEKQHKVPKVFLDGFSENNDGLFQYNLRDCILSSNPIQTSKLLKETDFYVFKDNQDKDNYFIEKFIFGNLLESKIGKIIVKLKKQEVLIEEDRQALSGFISYQYVRTDSFINSLRSSAEEQKKTCFMLKYPTLKIFEDRCLEIESKTGKDLGNFKKTYDWFISGDWFFDKMVFMQKAVLLGNGFRPHFLNAHYEVLETRKASFFLISDTPFFIIPPKNWKKGVGVGLFYPTSAEKIIPISKTQCLRIGLKQGANGPSISYKTINNKETNRINKYICKNAERFILSKNHEYLEKIVGQVDFRKTREEKEYNNYSFNKDFGIEITSQLFPL